MTGGKFDLEALEQQVRAEPRMHCCAHAGEVTNHEPGCGVVTLALIACIRELESEANNAAALLEAKSDLAARREWAKALRERVAKGVVLP